MKNIYSVFKLESPYDLSKDIFFGLSPWTLCRERRVFSGMVAALDEAVGNVTEALAETGLLDNTIIGRD